MKKNCLTLFLILLSSNLSFATGINDGLVAWFRAEEGAGTTVADNSGNGNTGTFQGGTTPGWSTGCIRQTCLSFTGVAEQRVNISTTNFSPTTGTVAVWIKANSFTPATGIVFCHGNGSISGCSTSQRIYIRLDGAALMFGYHGGANISGNYTMILNRWTHVAMTYNSGSMWMYVDGVQTNLYSPGGGDLTLNATAGIGYYAGGGGGGTSFDGLLDDLRVYNRVLTASELAMLANNRNEIRNAQINNAQVK